MGLFLTVVPALLAIVAVVAVVTLLVAERTRMLKCPNCGTVFKAPRVDQKISGLGWTFPFAGRVKCPKCGESRSRRDYQKAPAQAAPKAT